MAGIKPTMFIGSSVEGKRIAESIQELLEYEVDSTVWHQGVFGLSGGTLETLADCVDDFDFATLVLTADDLLEKRNVTGRGPRDNVLFELGLFMGALGRRRTFIVHSRSNPPLLPSDLAGITPATYDERHNLGAALGPACNKLRRAIEAEGARHRSESAVAYAPDPVKLNQILSEQHSMITELFRRLTDSPNADVRSAPQEGMEFLEGAWVSSSGSHGYCRLESQGPRLIYCWEGDASATGEYYDLKRIGNEIFGRFRWFEGDIRGFVWLKIDNPTELTGAWWMEGHVPVTAHDDPELLKRSGGMNSYAWTKQPPTTPPAWATAAFQLPHASAQDERSRLRRR
jgi:hypothetical protein